MIVHCVFCRAEDALGCATVVAELAEFAAVLDGVERFEHGPNRDFEGLSPGFTHGFVIWFRDPAALESYAAHPSHKALGARLLATCAGGLDGIMVFDLESLD